MIAPPRLALTLGEPAGIGPDICLQLAQEKLPAEVIIVGSPDLLYERAKILGLEIELYEFDPVHSTTANGQGRLAIYPLALAAPVVPGQLNSANSDYVVQTLQQGYQLCAQHYCDALVTNPVHKAIIAQSGITFFGHTEFFAALAGVSEVLMTFYTRSLILGLVTTHVPLQAVSTRLTADRLTAAISLLYEGLQHLFKKEAPKIHICGLNPHAGEEGLLGQEELLIMKPVIAALRQQGWDLSDPLPADTAFAPLQRQNCDAILAMYHDQGLAPFKALFFGKIVNITLGLPFLRTSVDHGTALNLAGTRKADVSSLRLAVATAASLSMTQEN